MKNEGTRSTEMWQTKEKAKQTRRNPFPQTTLALELITFLGEERQWATGILGTTGTGKAVNSLRITSGHWSQSSQLYSLVLY